MERTLNGKSQQVDPATRFAAAAEALVLAIDRECREQGSVDVLSLAGEAAMLRLGFRTLIELLAKTNELPLQLSQWDKAYTQAIERETERIKAKAKTRLQLAVSSAIPPRGN